MKILFITPKPVMGGAEKITLLVAKRMAQKGHTIHFACMCEPRERWEIDLENTITKVSLGTGIRAMFNLAARLRKVQYDAVFSSFLDINLILLALKPLSPKTSLIIRDALSLEFSHRLTLSPRVAKWMSRVLYRQADIHIAQTQEMADSNRNFLGEWYRPSVIHNPVGVDPKPNHQTFSQKPKLFLSVGRLTEQKGFLNLVDAFISAQKSLPSIMLNIVGNGEQLATLKEKIEKGNASHYISIHPRQKNLSEYYSTADAYVLSSNYEGFCNAALEALAHGIPLIASTQNTGVSSFANHMEHGILIPSNDPETITRGILELHYNYEKLSPVIISDSIARNFDNARILDQYESTILSTQHEPGRGRTRRNYSEH